MNIYELQKSLSDKHPDKEVNLRFTSQCKKSYEISMKDGKPYLMSYCIYDRVQVEVEGEEPYLTSIAPHRVPVNFVDMKSLVASFSEPEITDQMLEEISKFKEEEQPAVIQDLSTRSGISTSDLSSRLEAYKSKTQSKKEIPVLVD